MVKIQNFMKIKEDTSISTYQNFRYWKRGTDKKFILKGRRTYHLEKQLGPCFVRLTNLLLANAEIKYISSYDVKMKRISSKLPYTLKILG